MKLLTIIGFLQPVCTVYVLRKGGKSPIQLISFVFFFKADDYDSDQAPRVTDFNGKILEEDPLPVNLNVEIISFDEINTSKMTFK